MPSYDYKYKLSTGKYTKYEKKVAKLSKHYLGAAESFSSGEMSRKEFIQNFNSLRRLAQRRMDNMYSLGLDSVPLSNLSSFVYNDTGGSQVIPSATNSSNFIRLYNLMTEFVISPYSTPEEYKRQEQIIRDVIGSPTKWSTNNVANIRRLKSGDPEYIQDQYWINIFLEGHFWRLIKLFGTSDLAMAELESMLESGLSTFDIMDALDLSEAKGVDFDTAVEAVRSRKATYNFLFKD